MNCKVVMGVNMAAFGEYANMIKLSLEELGHSAEIVSCDREGAPERLGDLNIVTRAFRPYTGHSNGINVLYQSEELWHSRDSGVYEPRSNAAAWARTLEMYADNRAIPNWAGHDIHWCPYGYSEAYETDLPEVEEDIDILFFGAKNPLRMDFWQEITQHPAMKGRKMEYLYLVYGKQRDEYIMRSKIIINLKWVERWSYPPLRALLAQCKKKMFMVHDPNGGRDPFVNGKHFLEFKDANHFAELANKWLDNDKERKEFAVNAYEDIKKNHIFTDHLRTGLKGII